VSDRITVVYELAARDRSAARAKARDMVVEQTVEVPAACVPRRLRRTIVGSVERLERLGPSRWRVACSFDPGVVGDSAPQLFNLLFGNISMLAGIRLVDLNLPALPGLPGPAFGIPGLRELAGVPAGPLLCAAAKPIGLSSTELARICYDFAAGGAHIVKDDHGLANQPAAPFRERVARCQDAIQRANARTGGRTLYFPNLSRGLAELFTDLEYVRSLGCRGVLISPLLIGVDTVRLVAARGDVAVLSHPTFTGTLVQPGHGIAPQVLFGTLFRLIGSDGVIYPNAGGRFPFSLKSCYAINERLRAPLNGMRPAFPVPGGGVDAAHVPTWLDRYGPDTMFLVGSSLYAQRNLAAATARLVESMTRYSHA
jgi:ribulose-bisphosphate carboxylase large chain